MAKRPYGAKKVRRNELVYLLLPDYLRMVDDINKLRSDNASQRKELITLRKKLIAYENTPR